MAIVLICPGCKTRLTVGDDRAGTTFECPRCAVVISIPVIVPAPPPPPPTRPPAPAPRDYEPGFEPPAYTPESDSDDEPIPRYRSRRRPKRTNATRWIVAGVILLLACGVVAWIATRWSQREIPPVDVRVGAPGEPSARVEFSTDGPPSSWTHKDLADHLKTKGINVLVDHFPPLGDAYTVFAYFNDRETRIGVLVFLCATPRAAAERAGVLGEGAFATGRFALGAMNTEQLDGSKDSRSVALLRRIREALR